MKGNLTSEWRTSQLMSSRNFEVDYYRDKDFKAVEMHSHDFCELYYFIRGSASYIVENGHYSLTQGDILLIPPNDLHQLNIKDSSATYERIVLWLNVRYLRRISTLRTDLNTCFAQAGETGAYLVRNSALSARILSELNSLLVGKDDSSFGSDIACETHIKNILSALGAYYLDPTQVAPKHAEQNKTVSAAVAYINAHICDDLSLDKLSEVLFVNKYYLAHLFKEETNTAPHRYILKKRLVLSKQLIESGLPVTEVYAKCGFLDYTHFFRAFKSEYGLTPKQYYSLNRP